MKELIVKNKELIQYGIFVVLVITTILAILRDTSIQELYKQAELYRNEIEQSEVKLKGDCKNLYNTSLSLSGAGLMLSENKYSKATDLCNVIFTKSELIPKTSSGVIEKSLSGAQSSSPVSYSQYESSQAEVMLSENINTESISE